MRPSSRFSTLLATVLLALAASGCVGPGRIAAPATPADRVSVADRQVALDLLNAVLQLVERGPAPLRFERPASERGAVLADLHRLLGETGYVIVDGDADASDARAVRYRTVEIDSPEERLLRHDLVIGGVELSRSYRYGDVGTVVPVSALFVRGADATSVRMMDRRLFGVGPPGTVPPAVPASILATHALPPPADLAGGGTVDGGVASEETAGDEAAGDGAVAGSAPRHDVVVEHVLSFALGSDRLSEGDIALIDDIRSRFDPETDIISVVGYSAGGTAENREGIRDMAQRRAERVREALVAVGVPDDRLQIESFWSAADGADPGGVPARAAILSLKRETT